MDGHVHLRGEHLDRGRLVGDGLDVVELRLDVERLAVHVLEREVIGRVLVNGEAGLGAILGLGPTGESGRTCLPSSKLRAPAASGLLATTRTSTLVPDGTEMSPLEPKRTSGSDSR